METQVIIPEAWFVLNYKADKTGFEFQAYKIVGKNDITGIGLPKSMETETFPTLSGRVKFDGCIDFVFQEKNHHYCGIHHAEQLYLLFQEIYRLQEKLFEDEQ